MTADPDRFQVRLAQDERDLLAAQRCRYDVFVDELKGDGPLVDHAQRLERDEHDPFYEHLILVDTQRDDGGLDHVAGVYRLLRSDTAEAAGGFYCAREYDLSPLIQGGRKLLELGRSCLRPEYRGGPAMFHIWNGLAEYTLDHEIEVLFGVASFHGTDLEALAAPLTLLHHRHLAPEDLRVRALPAHYESLNRVPYGSIDRVAAMLEVPSLIKGYLRLGGFVGDGAFVDHAFNTTDICLVLDTERMNARQRAIYTRGLNR
ncbi:MULTISPECIES: GNAT family N-acetyltransferase [unclassified Meridianimarinicoccus]|uniref:GNAT family N-acetyltransferase n=1 Tax=unclassified Meridianimarinicoccus TaxID=2923344 RepID=UPI00186884E2|nr:GNAT family N-acyltransferase [Fluviibacterium sp. MJW13]